MDQPQGGSVYPFIRVSDDLEQLIGDVYLWFEDQLCVVEQPLRIQWLSGFGTETAANPAEPEHDYDLLIVDAEDAVVFDSRLAETFREVEWGDTKKVLEWVIEEERKILRVVIFSAWAPDQTVITWPVYLEPEHATLDPRTVFRSGPVVTRLIVETESGDVELPAESNIVLRGGYNVTITEDSSAPVDGRERVSSLVIAVQPGEGSGRFNDCREERYLLRLGGVSPGADGDISLDLSGCYKVRRPLSDGSPTAAVVALENDCGPCSDCDDYVNVYEAIRKLHNIYMDLGRQAEMVRDQFRANRERWERNRECREGSSVRLGLQPLVPCLLHVGAAYCNQTGDGLHDVTLSLDFSGAESPACLLCETVFRRGNVDPSSDNRQDSTVYEPYKLSGAWPSYTAHFDCLPPGGMGTVLFKLLFDGAGDDTQVSVAAEGSAEGVETSTAEAQTRLRCSFSDDDQCCQSSASSESSSSLAASGSVASIVKVAGAGNVVVNTAASEPPHGLIAGDVIVIAGSSVAPYNTSHEVQSVTGDRSVVTDVTHTSDAVGGSWQET